MVGVSLLAASYNGLFDLNPHNKQVTRVCRDLEDLDTGIAKFVMHAGRPPTGLEGLSALVIRPTTLERRRGWVQALKAIPSDPWGNAYVYRASTTGTQTTVTIASPGPDGTPNTEDDIETDPRTYSIGDVADGPGGPKGSP
ncbi:hypothetical protein llg_37080 [Luteolibacter sp. LG18]|nr:hypothetical protein llg_37080 [Luteolibacter sp. LG18]